MREVIEKIEQWHFDRNLINGATDKDQVLKLAQELGELSAAITKGKPLEECAEEMADILILLMGHSIAMKLDLKSAFEKKYHRIMQRKALTGRLGVRVTEYQSDN